MHAQTARAWTSREALGVTALLAIGLGIQLRFFATFPQPVLFGDPRGYYETGQRFLEAWASWRSGALGFGEAFDSVRGLFYLLGVGALFAVVDAVRPGDFGFFQVVLALFNTGAMLGCYLLGRRLSGSRLGGFLALGLAAVYPAFSVQTGRLYPDPVTACFFVWSAWLYLVGVQERRGGVLVAAGLTLCLAITVRAQLALYMLVVLPPTFAIAAPLWARRAETRRLAVVLALSLLPLAGMWWGIERAVGGRDDVTRLGNITFAPTYPFGFWQFLDSDGWSSAYQFKDEPYYHALVAENERQGGLFHSRPRLFAFTAGWVMERPLESVGVVLNNVYRFLDRPANDYKWDYPFDYRYQVWLQRLVALAAVVGLALFASESLASLGVFFLPAALVALHGMMFVWPRYHVPIMPILIAVAGATLARAVLAGGLGRAVRSRAFLAPAAVGLLALALGAAVFDALPEIGASLRVLGTLLLLALPFVLVSRISTGRHPKRWAIAVGAALGLVLVGHALRDRLWHESTLALGADVRVVSQEIVLTPEAIAELRGAGEAFLVFDLSVPRGDTTALRVRVAGSDYDGSALLPTMPRLPESTSTGGRDWRGYPQWWALPFDPAWLPAVATEPITVVLAAEDGAEALLRADRFGGQQRTYEGPSFGERPHMVPLKLEYDGDYRVPMAYDLGSRATTTRLGADLSSLEETAAVARIRIVRLANNEGWTTWRTAPAPSAIAAFGFFAHSGIRDEAALSLGTRELLRFPLADVGDFDLRADAWRLCRRSLGERGEEPYGAFALVGPAEPGQALELSVRFRTGMNERRMFFVVDPDRGLDEARTRLEACAVPADVPWAAGVAEVVDATSNSYPKDTGRWTIARVY